MYVTYLQPLFFTQDVSYYGCTEVSGKQHDIIASLSPLFSSDAGIHAVQNTSFVCHTLAKHQSCTYTPKPFHTDKYDIFPLI